MSNRDMFSTPLFVASNARGVHDSLGRMLAISKIRLFDQPFKAFVIRKATNYMVANEIRVICMVCCRDNGRAEGLLVSTRSARIRHTFIDGANHNHLVAGDFSVLFSSCGIIYDFLFISFRF